MIPVADRNRDTFCEPVSLGTFSPESNNKASEHSWPRGRIKSPGLRFLRKYTRSCCPQYEPRLESGCPLVYPWRRNKTEIIRRVVLTGALEIASDNQSTIRV